MVFITGDTHRNFGNLLYMVSKKNVINPGDTIIILGDAGINYCGTDSDDDYYLKRKLNKFGVRLFCVHGNHEMNPKNMPSYKMVYDNEFKGLVYKEDQFDNLLFAVDGERYTICDKKVLVIGGAYSVDKFYRLANGYRWFSDEQPTKDDKDCVSAKINDYGYCVDVVLSHTCPKKYIPVEAFLPFISQDTVDNSMEEWLDKIEDKLDYKKWYCGHWHINKKIDNMQFMYEDIEEFYGGEYGYQN